VYLTRSNTPSDWTTFVSPEHDFELSAPGQLVSGKPAPDVVPTLQFQLTASNNSYGIYFHVKRLDFPEKSIADYPSAAFDSVRDTTVSTVHGRLISEVPITLGDKHGREIRVSADGGKALATQRMYIAADRLYIILAVRKPSEAADGAVLRFLDSFHFTRE
jgi:hypothetical protein